MQCSICKTPKFDPWVGKLPWRRQWQPTPAFLPGEFHGQRSLEGYSPWVANRTLSTVQEQQQTMLNDFILTSSQVALVVKNPPVNARDKRVVGSISGLERFPWGGNGNPLQYFCLENPMDRGAWQATVHTVAKSRTELKRLGRYKLTS